MDDDLDDLFGDAPQLQLPTHLPKGLLQRMDERSLSGCRQKVDWSISGCISYISSDARNVILQHLLCDPTNGQWKLSKEYLVEDVPRYHSGGDLVHLSWSHTGNELAIVDRLGRISVLVVNMAINRINVVRRCTIDPEDDLGSVIGLMWLHVDKPTFFRKPVIKNNDLWNFSISQQRPTGPRNPSSKPAVVVVTRNGVVRVLSQDKSNQWQVLKDDSQSLAAPLDLLTHAAMCSDRGINKDDMLLATYDEVQDLHIYRIGLNIDQNLIKITHLKLVPSCVPSDDVLGDSLIPDDAPSPSTQLSLLDLVPAGPESKSQGSTQPFVLAVFSCVSDGYANGSDRSSVVCRWELGFEKPNVHSSFDQLSSKKHNAPSAVDLPVDCVLKRLPDLSMPRTLLSVHYLNVGVVLAMIFDDGLVEFRDRANLDLLSPDGDNQISSLSQIGFTFPPVGPCLQATLSPNACALFSLDGHYSATINMMHSVNQKSSLSGEAFLELVNEAFVTQCSISTMTSATLLDDLLATMQIFATQYLDDQIEWSITPSLSTKFSFNQRFMSEMYRILGVNVDYSVDSQPDQSFKIPLFQRVLSIQAAFGFSGDRTPRSLSGTIAWAALNTRYISMSFAWACQKSKLTFESELKNPDIVSYLLGLVSWSMALNNFLMDELFVLSDQFEDEGLMKNGIDCNVLNQKIREMYSPALPLLFVSTSRAILRYNCRYIRVIGAESVNNPTSTALGRLYQEFGMIITGALVKVDQIDKVLAQIDDSIKFAYQSSNISEADRKAAEENMLIKAELPQVLMEPVKRLLTSTVGALREEINVAELYLTDYSCIGLMENTSKNRRNENILLDTMRKVELRGDAKLKQCSRCCAFMEDRIPRKIAQQIYSSMRTCLCGSYWIMLDKTESSLKI